jgi:signal recognition particle receptor subunit beta
MDFVIVVGGVFGCGRTTFIQTLCGEVDRLPLGTNVSASGYWGGLAAEFESHKLYLIDQPGAMRFDFLWLLDECEYLGSLVVINSAAPETFRGAQSFLETMRAYSEQPYIGVANHQDHPNAFSAEDIEILFRSRYPIVPCVATERASVKAIVIRLLEDALEG